MCSITTTTATGATRAMAPGSKRGMDTCGRPTHAASATGAKSTRSSASETR